VRLEQRLFEFDEQVQMGPALSQPELRQRADAEYFNAGSRRAVALEKGRCKVVLLRL
jgi:hypothetical protein